jgi:hypothetical protein
MEVEPNRTNKMRTNTFIYCTDEVALFNITVYLIHKTIKTQ